MKQLHLMDGTTVYADGWNMDELLALKMDAYRKVKNIPADQPLTAKQIKEAANWKPSEVAR